jgi:hypothetical protein
LGILNNVFKPNLVQRQSQLKAYNILAVPSLLYGCEVWALKQRDIKRLKTTEKKFTIHTAVYSSLNHTRNYILEELKVNPAVKKLAQYKQNWLNHVNRMEYIRYSKFLLDYGPIRRRPG